MSYGAAVRKVISGLRERHPRFVPLTPRILLYAPAENCSKLVVLENRGSRGYFTVEWRINIMCEPDARTGISLGRSWGLVGRSTRFKPKGQGGLFEVDDPTMAEDFADQIEAEVMPLFDSLDTFGKTVEFVLAHQYFPIGSWVPWRALMTAACGDIPEAQRLWRSCDTDQVQCRVPQTWPDHGNYDEWCRVAEPLMDGDRAALAKLLHEWEQREVLGTKLERYWTSMPFPLETIPSIGPSGPTTSEG